MKRILFALSGLCCGLTVGAASLLEFDGSFEKTPLGETSKFVHWTFYSPVPNIKTEIVTDAPPGLPVRKALRVDYTKALPKDNSRSFYSDFLPIDPKQNYRQSVWLKTDGKSERGYGVNLGRHFYDANKKLIAYPEYHAKSLLFRNQGPTKWTRFEQTLRPQKDPKKVEAGEIPTNAAYVRIYFNSYGYNRTYTITGHEFKPVMVDVADVSCPADGLWARPASSPSRPVIDGKLDDPAWTTADEPWYGDFRRTICKPELSGEMPKGQTAFKVWRDRDVLVVAVRCTSAESGKILSAARPQNDGKIFGDETVEIHLDITGSRRYIYQLTVNPDGSWAQYFNKVPRKFPVRVAANRGAGGWTAEMEIPLTHLWTVVSDAGGIPDSGGWNFNCCRTQPGAAMPERFSAWNPTGFYFFNPQAMGIILLCEPAELLQRVADNAAAAAGTVEWKNLAVLSENPALEAQLAELKLAARIPEEYQKQLASGKDISRSAFAAGYRFLYEFHALLRRSIEAYTAHNFRFPENRKRFGCFFHSVPLCAPVHGASVPDMEAISDRFKMTMAGDELAEMRLRLFAGEDLRDLRLTCSSLKGSDGAEIPLASVDVRIITPWGSGHQADLLATDLRIPLQGFLRDYARAERFIPEIVSGGSRDILLMVRTTPGQKPGHYTGTLTVAPAGKEPSRIALDVEVLPFDLPPAEQNVGFYSHAVIFSPDAPAIGTPGAQFYNGRESEKSFLAAMKMLHDYGFNFVIQTAYRGGPLNPEYCEMLLRLMSSAGIRRVALMGAEHLISPAAVKPENTAMLEDRRKILRERAQAVSALAKKYRFQSFYLYGFDEPNDDAGITRNNIIFEICRELQIPTIVSCIFEDVRRKIGNLDAVIMSYQSMTSQDHDLLHHPENGLKRMYYCNLQSGFDTAVRMNFGWYLEKSGFDGAAPWALYYLAHYWDPFRDFHASKEDYANNCCYVFLTEDEPIPTMKLIAAHAGVSDLRYAAAFKAALKKCHDPKRKEALQKRYEAILNHFDLRNPQHNQSRNFKHAPELYDRLRSEIQQLILDCSTSR